MRSIEFDTKSRVTIAGHAGETFLVSQKAEGSILLEPVGYVVEAQLEYDGEPELQELLVRAACSGSVATRRTRA